MSTQLEAQGRIYSGMLHVVVLLIGIFGLPEIWESHRESLPVVMTVEVLPIGQTNVKPQTASKPVNKPKVEQPKAPKPKPQTQQPKPQPKTEPLPLPKPEEKKPEPAKEKPTPKPEPKKEDKPKPVPEENQDLSDILRSVEEAARSETGEDETFEPVAETKQAVSDTYNPSLPLAMSEIDAIRQQFMKCWNIPAGAKDAYNLKVVVEVQLTVDGQVTAAELASDKARYYSDTFFRAAADSAIRAVHACSPLQNLPSDKYDTWKHLELTFDPQEVLY
jgi:outer membrane biosynthesis protein TonB